MTRVFATGLKRFRASCPSATTSRFSGVRGSALFWIAFGAAWIAVVSAAIWTLPVSVLARFVLAVSAVGIAWQIVRLHARLDACNRRDVLTGVHSREAFYECLARLASQSRHQAGVASLVVIDCDHFKRINDTYGHCAGDDVLRAVAATLVSSLPESAVVGRLWGDAFAVLLPGHDETAGKATMDHARHALDAAMFDREWPMTFSVGGVTFGPDWALPSSRAEELLPAADTMMYAVKHAGRDGLQWAQIDAANSERPPFATQRK